VQRLSGFVPEWFQYKNTSLVQKPDLVGPVNGVSLTSRASPNHREAGGRFPALHVSTDARFVGLKIYGLGLRVGGLVTSICGGEAGDGDNRRGCEVDVGGERDLKKRINRDLGRECPTALMFRKQCNGAESESWLGLEKKRSTRCRTDY